MSARVHPSSAPPPSASPGTRPATEDWVRSQSINLLRHAQGLRSFEEGEFGTGPASPSRAHLRPVNRILGRLRTEVVRRGKILRRVGQEFHQHRDRVHAHRLLAHKENGERAVKRAEPVWEFYFGVFRQRTSRHASFLLAADRIATDCYRAVYTGLGTSRPVPSPTPFSYLESRLSPATFRRGIRTGLLGGAANPFPLVKLPMHRLLNPWTLGGVAHEVAHNIQHDLELWERGPRSLAAHLRSAGLAPAVVGTWVRWQRELFADLLGLLLSGPAYVSSLAAVLARTPRRTVRFRERAVHPVPYWRLLISLELLRRLGFRAEAAAWGRFWSVLYPPTVVRSLPVELRRTFPKAARATVDRLCFAPLPELGHRSLVQVVPFGRKEQSMIDDAAGRLATGTISGIVPERFLIGAARTAIRRRLARPGPIVDRFYETLVRR